MPYVQTTSGDSVKVPDAELDVLTVLHNLGQETHGPAIARASNGTISTGAVYTLLARLERRGLVEKREGAVKLGDITVTRVMYQVCATVKWP